MVASASHRPHGACCSCAPNRGTRSSPSAPRLGRNDVCSASSSRRALGARCLRSRARAIESYRPRTIPRSHLAGLTLLIAVALGLPALARQRRPRSRPHPAHRAQSCSRSRELTRQVNRRPGFEGYPWPQRSPRGLHSDRAPPVPIRSRLPPPLSAEAGAGQFYKKLCGYATRASGSARPPGPADFLPRGQRLPDPGRRIRRLPSPVQTDASTPVHAPRGEPPGDPCLRRRRARPTDGQPTRPRNSADGCSQRPRAPGRFRARPLAHLSLDRTGGHEGSYLRHRRHRRSEGARGRGSAP